MKTAKFIKEVEKLGLAVRHNSITVVVMTKELGFLGAVSQTSRFTVDTMHSPEFESSFSDELMDLIAEFAKTPLKDRK